MGDGLKRAFYLVSYLWGSRSGMPVVWEIALGELVFLHAFPICIYLLLTPVTCGMPFNIPGLDS